MARFGLRTFLYAPVDAGDETKYSEAPATLAGAISCKVALTQNDTAVYVNDGLKYLDTSINKGVVTLDIDDDDESIFAGILGKTKTEKTAEGGKSTAYTVITSNKEDITTPVGFGYITRKLSKKDGKTVVSYKVNFFHKVIFKDFGAEDKTDGEKREIKTQAVEGTICILDNGDWRQEAILPTLEEAVSVLKGLFVQAN